MMGDVAMAIIVVGLALVSCYAMIKSKGRYGRGWGLISFLILFFNDWT